MKKTISILAMMVILIASFSFALSCGDTITQNTIMTGDLLNCDTSHGLILDAPDITLDCAGYTIHSSNMTSTYYGIAIKESTDNSIIQNCVIENFMYGFSTEGNSCTENKSNMIIQNMILVNGTTANYQISLSGTGCNNIYNHNLLMRNFDIYVMPYKYGGIVDMINSNIDNFTLTCQAGAGQWCDHTIAFNDLISSSITNIRTTNLFGTGIYMGNGNYDLQGQNNIFENIVLNLTEMGDPIAFSVNNQINLTLRNVQTSYDGDPLSFAMIYAQADMGNVYIIDSNYGYGREWNDELTPIYKSFTASITTNIGDVNLNITSIQDDLVQISTDSEGVLLIELLEHLSTGNDGATITNSTPYNVVAYTDTESFSQSLDIGAYLPNLLLFSEFTEPIEDEYSIDNDPVYKTTSGIISAVLIIVVMLFIIVGAYENMKGKRKGELIK